MRFQDISKAIAAATIALLAVAPSSVDAKSLSRGPYLQVPTSNSMTIRWQTEEPSVSIIKYSESVYKPYKPLKLKDMFLQKDHEYTLEGLKPNTKYFYSIYTLDKKGREVLLTSDDEQPFFKTKPETTVPVRIWVLGDAGSGKSIQKRVAKAYYKFTEGTDTDLIITLGDNAYPSGSEEKYNKVIFKAYEDILPMAPIMPSFGNHDSGSKRESGFRAKSYPKPKGPYYDVFTLPSQGESGGVASGTEAYYSFDYSNIHFINLDSYDSFWVEDEEKGKIIWSKESTKTNAMLEWLKQDLEANSQKENQDWTVVYFHHPAYVNSKYEEIWGKWMRENVVPLINEYGVDLVLSGHTHRYLRSYMIDSYFSENYPVLEEKHTVNLSSGREDEETPYIKDKHGKGTVYVIAGSAGRLKKSDEEYQTHPLMFDISDINGSFVIDVNDQELKCRFLNSKGEVKDYFTMQHDQTLQDQN